MSEARLRAQRALQPGAQPERRFAAPGGANDNPGNPGAHGGPGDAGDGRAATFASKVTFLAAMGVLFFTTYGLANWLAGRHASVPTFSFGWERHLPFWPWTIVPYWSIDLLYAGSFFLWATRGELHAHVKRLLTVQCICVAAFIAWPLRFGFDRPAADGLFGALFTLLAGFDKPFNQAPSLHIGLLVVLWVAYAMRLRGGWRWLLHAWFALIGMSVLTTFQHHSIDVPTGAAVGCFALFLLPMDRPGAWLVWQGRKTQARADAAGARRLMRARRLARRYGAGALGALLATWAALPGQVALALVSGWIGLALLCVALVYWSGDAARFQKDAQGDMPWPILALLAPTILGAFANSRGWTFRHPEPSPIGHGIFVGRTPTRSDLRRAGVSAVVDLSAEMPRWVRPSPTLGYLCVPQLDLLQPTVGQLQQAVDAIDALRAGGRQVLVCCALGYSRSALSAAAWLAMHLDLGDAPAALALLRQARPQVVLAADDAALLQRYIDERGLAQRPALTGRPGGADEGGDRGPRRSEVAP